MLIEKNRVVCTRLNFCLNPDVRWDCDIGKYLQQLQKRALYVAKLSRLLTSRDQPLGLVACLRRLAASALECVSRLHPAPLTLGQKLFSQKIAVSNVSAFMHCLDCCVGVSGRTGTWAVLWMVICILVGGCVSSGNRGRILNGEHPPPTLVCFEEQVGGRVATYLFCQEGFVQIYSWPEMPLEFLAMGIKWPSASVLPIVMNLNLENLINFQMCVLHQNTFRKTWQVLFQGSIYMCKLDQWSCPTNI